MFEAWLSWISKCIFPKKYFSYLHLSSALFQKWSKVEKKKSVVHDGELQSASEIIFQVLYKLNRFP